MFSPEIHGISTTYFHRFKRSVNFQFYLWHFLQLFVNTQSLFTTRQLFVVSCLSAFVSLHTIPCFGLGYYAKGLEFSAIYYYTVLNLPLPSIGCGLMDKNPQL